MFLRLEGLVKKFGNNAALKGISLSVKRGEILALLGPSGCGKTTTLRIIGGLENPSDGTVVINDNVLASADRNVPPEKRNMSMVFQSYALWPHMTIYENVAYGLNRKRINKKEIKNKVINMLRFVEMDKYIDNYPAQLSGGQQQRISVARALVTEPELVLFDEPLSNLDKNLREMLRLELRKIHKEKSITGIYVTHNQEEAFTLGDRVAVLNDGIVQQIGTPREIYYKPANKFVANFVGTANIFDAEVIESDANKANINFCGASFKNIDIEHHEVKNNLISVMIRPENIEILKNNNNDLNVLKGKLIDLVPMGSITDVFVDVKGATIRCQTLMDIASYLRPDDVVCLRIQEHHIVPVSDQ